MKPVFEAARRWWRNHRPLDWSEAQHLRNPTVNTTTDAEYRLARAVARAVGDQHEQRKRGAARAQG